MKTSNKKKITVKITWSIHECKKFISKGKMGSCQIGYMTVKKIGRKKEKVMHKTLGKALAHIGF